MLGEYMKKLTFYFSVAALFCLLGLPNVASAGVLDFANSINAIGGAVNSINHATRGTMSTIEYSQRFSDRRQERRDRKSVEAQYNNDTEAEYYRTIQETQQLEQRSQQNNL